MQLRTFLTVFWLFNCGIRLPPASGLIEDVLDIVHVGKVIGEEIFKSWELLKRTNLDDNIDVPIMREKQKTVLRQMKELSRQIEQSESRYINTLEGTISFVHAFIKDNTRFELRMHEISDIMNMIAIRHKQMKRYEAIQDKLEPMTLMTYAGWTVSPNAHSVHFLLEQLHLIFVGDEDKESQISSKGVLQMFADMMETYSKGKGKERMNFGFTMTSSWN